MKKIIFLTIAILMSSNLKCAIPGPGPGEEADITGAPTSALTPFQDIRNLSKGLFWLTYIINQKIKNLQSPTQSATLTSEELYELQAVLLTWDKLLYNLIEGDKSIFNADQNTLDHIKDQISKCSTMQNIKKAFKTIPDNLPTIPVFTPAPEDSKKLFPAGKFDESTYERKYKIYRQGIENYNEFIKKDKGTIEDAIEGSAINIMFLNTKEDR